MAFLHLIRLKTDLKWNKKGQNRFKVAINGVLYKQYLLLSDFFCGFRGYPFTAIFLADLGGIVPPFMNKICQTVFDMFPTRESLV